MARRIEDVLWGIGYMLLLAAILWNVVGCHTPRAVERYAIDHGRLHPEIVLRGQSYFPRYDLNDVTVSVHHIPAIPARGSATAMYVTDQTLHVMPGALNYPGVVRGNTMDLATPGGFATLMHELRHCEQAAQGHSEPFLKIFGCSLRQGKLYAHECSYLEQDAIEFQKGVLRNLATSKPADWLDGFKEMR